MKSSPRLRWKEYLGIAWLVGVVIYVVRSSRVGAAIVGSLIALLIGTAMWNRFRRWRAIRTKGYFGGRAVNPRWTYEARWMYEEQFDGDMRALLLPMELTEPGRWELFLPDDVEWRATVPEWAHDRRSEIVARITEELDASRIHEPGLLDSPVSREEEIIRAVEALLDRCRRLYDQLLRKYPNDDLRPVFVAAAGNALRSYHLFFAMVLSTITHESWWQQQFGLAQLRDIDRGAVGNLDTTTRFAFFVVFLSHIEWSMRKLVTHISPGACKKGGAEFKSVHDHVLTTLGLKLHIPLYDLCRMVRNSVHSNGIYIDKNGNDIQINWKGVDYKFTHLQPVDFMTYEFTLQLYGDLIDSIEEILAHPVVATPAVMHDRLV